MCAVAAAAAVLPLSPPLTIIPHYHTHTTTALHTADAVGATTTAVAGSSTTFTTCTAAHYRRHPLPPLCATTTAAPACTAAAVAPCSTPLHTRPLHSAAALGRCTRPLQRRQLPHAAAQAASALPITAAISAAITAVGCGLCMGVQLRAGGTGCSLPAGACSCTLFADW